MPCQSLTKGSFFNFLNLLVLSIRDVERDTERDQALFKHPQKLGLGQANAGSWELNSDGSGRESSAASEGAHEQVAGAGSGSRG